MTCLVVMQPTVLPWSGYFNLIAESDIFVFHDDIQLEKRSWQTRNKLIFEKKEAWVTIPIRHDSENQKIFHTQVLIDQKWSRDILRKFTRNYQNHPFFLEGLDVFNQYINSSQLILSQRNEDFIKYVSAKLNLNRVFYKASELNINGVRSEKLINLCDFFEAKKYLSPVGSKQYLEIDRFSERARAKLNYQDYSPDEYPQIGLNKFMSHLSIVDVICNLGFSGASSYILKK